MKIRVLLFALAGSLLIAPGFLHAADRPQDRRHEKQTELGRHMEKMGRAFRALGRQINDPSKNADSLKLVEIIRTNAQAGLDLKPAKTADVPTAEQAAFVADYRQTLKNFLGDVATLESALKANDNGKAADLVQKLKHDMFSAHKKFKKKKDEM